MARVTVDAAKLVILSTVVEQLLSDSASVIGDGRKRRGRRGLPRGRPRKTADTGPVKKRRRGRPPKAERVEKGPELEEDEEVEDEDEE